MNDTIVIRSHADLGKLVGIMSECLHAEPYLRVTLSSSPDRSLNQNALAAVWYAQISREMGEETPEEVKAFCKLVWGVPILRAEDEEFRKTYDASLKTLPYNQKLAIMKYLPVTSIMNTAQMSQYLETMHREYAKHGVELKFPEDD